MSIEAARNFCEKVINDPDLLAELTNCRTVDERMAIAQQMGYQFTPEELSEARQGVISDEELDGMSGGIHDGYCCLEPN